MFSFASSAVRPRLRSGYWQQQIKSNKMIWRFCRTTMTHEHNIIILTIFHTLPHHVMLSVRHVHKIMPIDEAANPFIFIRWRPWQWRLMVYVSTSGIDGWYVQKHGATMPDGAVAKHAADADYTPSICRHPLAVDFSNWSLWIGDLQRCYLTTDTPVHFGLGKGLMYHEFWN